MKERNLKTTVRDFFNNNKLLSSSWGINYIWIILISIILGIIIVFISGHHLRRELNSGNQAFVDAYGQNIDNVLTSAKQTEYQIMSDRKILNFISTPFDDKRNMILSASDISSKLAVLVHNNYWLENIYLYSKKTTDSLMFTAHILPTIFTAHIYPSLWISLSFFQFFTNAQITAMLTFMPIISNILLIFHIKRILATVILLFCC